MRFLIIALCLCTFLFSCQQAGEHKGSLKAAKAYQEELSAFWKNDSSTPLHAEEKAEFKGITFFPLSEAYVVTATFSPIADGKVLPMPTSARKTKYFKEYGTLHFTLKDTPVTLTVYQSDPPHEEDRDGLFLPFTDQTSGKTSYGAGRYIDLSTKDIRQFQVTIDFNQAYNPYCAYSTYYNCPIPPANNRMPVAVSAGVSYQNAH
ncbi:DUF1684 domain-containing protein [Taibaiella sp. KBW10]|uniref:DUF1684 domain-containing protein n=1 Tax=Taibaiella sp. KBW10 TaxID=2153357 RepID=UPI00131583AB|nr:DUF1684 domain-containing protein [Taibaiella sp. KBW10]